MTGPSRQEGDGGPGWLSYSLPQGIGSCDRSAELERVYQRKRGLSRGVWSGRSIFPDHAPKRHNSHIPWLKHRGFPVRLLEPRGMFHTHLYTLSRSSISSFLSHHTCFCRMGSPNLYRETYIDVTFQYITIKQLYKRKSLPIPLRSLGSQAKPASELVGGLYSRPTHP